MLTSAAITDWINAGLAVGVCLACCSMAGRMNRATRCAIRFGIFGIFAGALLYAFGGVWDFGDWVQTVTLGSILIYLVANLRQPFALPSSRWADGLAWSVTIAIVCVLGLTFSGG